MCDAISWIEKSNEILFTHDELLTAEIVAREKKLNGECCYWNEIKGHGLVRKLYGKDDMPLKGGKEYEENKLTNPKKFPIEIQRAVRAGQFSKVWISEQLLTPKGVQLWLKKFPTFKQAKEAYEQAEATYYQAHANLDRTWPTEDVIYEQAWVNFDRAWKACDKDKLRAAFWTVFKNKKNRILAWR